MSQEPPKREETYQIFISATPFTRVIEGKCFAVATRTPYAYGIASEEPLSNEHWSDFAAKVAYPAEPEEYSPAAMERFMQRMKDYVIEVKGIRSQFKAINQVKIVPFDCPADAERYHNYYENYLREKARIEGDSGASTFDLLAQLTILQKGAEEIRAPMLARRADAKIKAGKAAVIACKFKSTIAKVVMILINEYGYSRNDISLIWGGGVTKRKLSAKARRAQELKKQMDSSKELDADLNATLAKFGLDLKDLIAEQEKEEQEKLDKAVEEDADFKANQEKLRLGPQSRKQRQEEIDRFQAGKSKVCIFSFKAGGCGLSLHHTDELTTTYNTEAPGYAEWKAKIDSLSPDALYERRRPLPGKARRKRSGFAVEEDIPYILTKPRSVYVAPVYSAIELVQALGRGPRLTSLSDTDQWLLFFAGTIEVPVAITVSQKLKCLRKVVETRESWEDIILGNKESETTSTEDANRLAQRIEEESKTEHYVDDEGEADNNEDEEDEE